MFKLDLEKAEEPEIKLPTCVGSEKKQENSRKPLLLLYWLCQSLWLHGSQKTGKLLEIGISNHLPCLLRNLYARQEATVRTRHRKMDWFKTGKGIHQSYILSSCLFNIYAEYIMRNAGLDEAQVESRLPGEISVTSYVQMTPPLWQKAKKN